MSNEKMNVNRYYLTLPSYQINPIYLDEPQVNLGCGINLSDPLLPVVAPYSAFAPSIKAGKRTFALPKSADVINESFVLRESLTASEESSVLSGYFKASYMLSSVKAAYETAREEQKNYHTIYALIEHSGESERLPSDLRHWKKDEPPNSETISDKDKALLQFVSSYGSHYVSAMRYGLRIAIQGKIKKDSSTEASKFSASFKAAFGSIGADGGVDTKQKQKLEEMSVDLLLEVSSGGRDDNGLLVMHGFDDISKFLDDVRKNQIKFSVAPIELTLKPYWATLDPKWENTRAALDPNTADFNVPSAQYGVPEGTIIAWHPTANYVQGLQKDSNEKKIVPPPGWAICDGTLGTPDLSNHFIMGTTAFEEVGKVGGDTKHLNVKLGNVAKKAGLVTATKKAVISVEEIGTEIPANVKFIFIMKLHDLP